MDMVVKSMETMTMMVLMTVPFLLLLLFFFLLLLPSPKLGDFSSLWSMVLMAPGG